MILRMRTSIRARIRLDFRGEEGRQSLLSGRIRAEKAAENSRQRQASVLKNLPWQGVTLEEIEANQEVYTIPTAERGEKVAYAPVELLVKADSLEDLVPFILREEFRKIKILDPEEMVFSNYDVERAIFKMGIEFRAGFNQEG